MANYHVSWQKWNFKIQKEWWEKASKISISTQKEAIELAKKFSGNNWGWEVSIHSEKWPIRAKDTIEPWNDPREIKG